MDPLELLNYVDHTQLKPFATWRDIEKLCREALEYRTASVCIPPAYVSRAHRAYPKLNICTVIGFPLGYSTRTAKQEEIRQALLDGANELDMVVNISDVKNGDFALAEEEIRVLKRETGDKILKVIIETGYLDEEEKIAMCQAVTGAGADYIKTSTGFGPRGASLEDILLFKKYIGPGVKMKAAGGIKTLADLERFVEAGCSRIGTSSAIDMIKNKVQANDY